MLAEELRRIVREAGDDVAVAQEDALLRAAAADHQRTRAVVVLRPLQDVADRERGEAAGEFHGGGLVCYLHSPAFQPDRRGKIPHATRTHCEIGSSCSSLSTLAALATPPVSALFAAEPPCRLCAGVLVDDPFAAAAAARGRSRDSRRRPVFFVAWDAPLDGTASPAGAHRLAAAGARPWIRLLFSTPAPLLEHLDGAAARGRRRRRARPPLAAADPLRGRLAGGRRGVRSSPRGHAFLVKRVAVAVTGAQPEARDLRPAAAAGYRLARPLVRRRRLGLPRRRRRRPGRRRGARRDPRRARRPRPRAAGRPGGARSPGRRPAGGGRSGAPGDDRLRHHLLSRRRLRPRPISRRSRSSPTSSAARSSPIPARRRPGGTAWSFVRGEDLGLRVSRPPRR